MIVTETKSSINKDRGKQVRGYLLFLTSLIPYPPSISHIPSTKKQHIPVPPRFKPSRIPPLKSYPAYPILILSPILHPATQANRSVINANRNVIQANRNVVQANRSVFQASRNIIQPNRNVIRPERLGRPLPLGTGYFIGS